MAMYVCYDCVKEHNLPTEIFTASASCEVCGELRNDWQTKFTFLTWALSRLGPVAEQLVKIRTRLMELDGSNGTEPAATAVTDSENKKQEQA